MSQRHSRTELNRRTIYAVAALAVGAGLLVFFGSRRSRRARLATGGATFLQPPRSAPVELRIPERPLATPAPASSRQSVQFSLAPVAAPETVAPAPAELAARAARPISTRAWLVSIVGFSVLAIAVAALFVRLKTREQPAAVSAPQAVAPAITPVPPAKVRGKSIAILPFENLSYSIDDTFLADAIQDQLLSTMAKVRDLTVISRASLTEYKPYGSRNLRDIGSAVGAANVVEGTVRRDGDRLRVTLTLSDAQDSEHLWSHIYDRAIADAVSLAADVTNEIAATVGASMNDQETASIAIAPTQNSEAYLLYLRAHETQTRLTVEPAELSTAVSLYEQAIGLDPAFALAYAGLSRAHSSLHQIADRSQARADQGKAAADRALQLQPDLPEAHAARGLCYYWGDRDYETAARDLTLAAEGLPNDSALLKTLALLRRRQGAWREAMTTLERSAQLDPRNPLTLGSLGDLYVELREWDGADRARQKLAALAAEAWPELAAKAKIDAAMVTFWRTGQVDGLRATLADIGSSDDPEGEIAFTRFDTNMLARDFVAADQVLNDSALAAFRLPSGSRVPKSFLRGCVALGRGDLIAARALFDEQRASLEADVARSPDDANRHAFLGMFYSFLGRKQDAIREGRRAVDLAPEFFDAVNAAQIAAIQALIYARAGQADDALPLLERLLTLPAAVSQHITVADLRARWEWDPIRADPRFQKIITEPEPKTVYN